MLPWHLMAEAKSKDEEHQAEHIQAQLGPHSSQLLLHRWHTCLSLPFLNTPTFYTYCINDSCLILKSGVFFFSFFFSDTEETKNTGVSALNSFAYFRTEYRSNLVDTKHISGMTTLFQSPCFIFKMGFEVAAQTCSQSYSIGCPAHSTNISLTSTGAISCYLSPSSIPLKSFGEVLTQACSTNGIGEDKQSPWSLKATISVSWPSTEFAWPLHGSLATLSMCFVCSSSR